MNETSGTTAADSSGNGYAATYVGGCTLGQTSLLPGGGGKSVLLVNSSGGYVAVPTGFLATLLKRPFSILTFFRTSSLARYQQIFASGAGGINLYLGTDGKMILGLAGVSNIYIDTRALSINTNYMIGVTVSAAGEITFYINKSAGTKSTTNQVTSAMTGSDSARLGDWIGGNSPPYQYSMDGRLQNTILSNVELSSTEIGVYYDSL